MGCTMRDKHTRNRRRTPRLVGNESDHSNSTGTNSNVEKPVNVISDVNSLNQKPSPNSTSNSSSGFDDSWWGYCNEEQLEEILLKNLDSLYNEAIDKLVALGHDEELALKAILRNGHFYGGMDVLTNIFHNSLAYLNSVGSNEGNVKKPESANFSNLRQLEQHSLAGMVSLLQQVRPNLSKGDALWCLFMSGVHLGRASAMEAPASQLAAGSGCEKGLAGGNSSPEGSISDGGSVGVAPAPLLCRFHGSWGFGHCSTSEFPTHGVLPCASQTTSQREIECPKRFNLSPSMKSLLKRNVAMFATGFRANLQLFNSQSQACPNSAGNSLNGGGTASELISGHNEESQYKKSQDSVNLVMNKFRNLNLDENTKQVTPLDQKDEMILSVIHQIMDIEKQVAERKEWARQKAMQAARKLSHDLIELKTLRMEREETQRQKKGKQALEGSTMKRVAEMENALRKASGQVDHANAAVRKLETENAEIRAEMEASKLSASESLDACLEVEKREKKFLKKLLGCEKQKIKMQEDIAAEKQKILEMQQELALVDTAVKDAEANWRQEQKCKELALAQVEEERRLKEASDANNKRKIESLRLKLSIDSQRHEDDLQRLKQEYARLKESSQSAKEERQSNKKQMQSNFINAEGEASANLLRELNPLEEDSSEKETGFDRKCMICLKDEVSVVFLPCAHQVICGNCNDNYGKKGKAKCPYCRVLIEQRIRVYGASP